jgi:hypothetical protein
MAAVPKAVAAGHITPSDEAEIGKVIDIYVRTYRTAELDERVVLVVQLSDAELMRVAMGGHPTESFPPLTRLAIFSTTGSRSPFAAHARM